MNYFIKIIEIFSPAEKKNAALLLLMIFVMAVLDVLGIASIFPFMAVLADPSLIKNNTYLSWIYVRLGFATRHDFLIFLGLASFILLVISIAFKAVGTYLQLRFALMREYSLGKRLIERYLRQPYSWFLNRQSNDMGKTILSEMNIVVQHAILPMIVIIAQSAVVLLILAMLFALKPLLALVVGSTLAIVYGVIIKVVANKLTRIGYERIKENQRRFIATGEAFSAVKEIKISGLEDVYIERFGTSAMRYADYQASALIISALPRYALEAVAFGGMLLLLLYLLIDGGGLATALPIISLYAFAGYRLMPALQQIYSNIALLKFAGPALDKLHSDLVKLALPNQFKDDATKMTISERLELKNISFTYPDANKLALSNISMNIPVLSTVGLVGSSGSGKSTTIDIIAGLLNPEIGIMEVDGVVIEPHNCRNWQRSIGYVPQQIYLSDDTIAANIAFGIDPDKVDLVALEQAARIANLHDFINSDLPDGYMTKVGERGVRLSGGQRQRIGIARAVYHQPLILILDEATSALDNLNERAVMDAVNNLSHKITIIIVAHRLSTVRQCDKLYLFEGGQVSAVGTYDELVSKNALFKKMAKFES